MTGRYIRDTDIIEALGYTPLENLVGQDASQADVTISGVTQTVADALGNSGSIKVSDGTTTIVSVKELDVVGASISNSNGKAVLTITTPSPEPSLTISDGTTSVSSVSELDVVGGSITNVSGKAVLTITAPQAAKQFPFGYLPPENSFVSFNADSDTTITSADTNVISIRRKATVANYPIARAVPLTRLTNASCMARLIRGQSSDPGCLFGVLLIAQNTNLCFAYYFDGNGANFNSKALDMSNGAFNFAGDANGPFNPGWSPVDLKIELDNVGNHQVYFSTDCLPFADSSGNYNSGKTWCKLGGAYGISEYSSISTGSVTSHFGFFMGAADANDYNNSNVSQNMVSCLSFQVIYH